MIVPAICCAGNLPQHLRRLLQQHAGGDHPGGRAVEHALPHGQRLARWVRACVPRACVPRACFPRACFPRACFPRVRACFLRASRVTSGRRLAFGLFGGARGRHGTAKMLGEAVFAFAGV